MRTTVWPEMRLTGVGTVVPFEECRFALYHIRARAHHHINDSDAQQTKDKIIAYGVSIDKAFCALAT